MLRARPYERRVATMSSEANAKKFADRCIADQFWPIRGFQNPITTSFTDKIPDHGAHFATKRPLVVKNRGSKPFETFPFLKCRAFLYKAARNRVSNGIDLKWFLTGPRGVTPGRTPDLHTIPALKTTMT